MSAPSVHVVVPDGVADPARPSGGNTYDRRLCTELRAAGWAVHETEVLRDPACVEDTLRAVLAELPDGCLALVDGLLASHRPAVVVPACRRLRVVVLLHMPVGAGGEEPTVREAESATLHAASSVLVPSAWCKGWLLASYGLDAARVHVARPGVDPATATPGSPSGGRLLCVGAVTRVKGQDLLVRALSEVGDLAWHCTVVGATSLAPDIVLELHEAASVLGLHARLELVGPLTGADLEAAYAGADLLVHPSRSETYGMVVTEALARGLPVLATAVGGVPEALGATTGGARPGLLVPPDDPGALAAALRTWLVESSCREGLRAAALDRRTGLTGWADTAAVVAHVLREAA